MDFSEKSDFQQPVLEEKPWRTRNSDVIDLLLLFDRADRNNTFEEGNWEIHKTVNTWKGKYTCSETYSLIRRKTPGIYVGLKGPSAFERKIMHYGKLTALASDHFP